MALSEKFMAILACPACRGKLLDRESYLLCPACLLKFPLRDGIAVLLLAEAEEAKDERDGRQ